MLEQIRSIGLIPVIRAGSADEAAQAADAIQAGGVGVLEITMTVPGAVEVIREVAGRGAAELHQGARRPPCPDRPRAHRAAST